MYVVAVFAAFGVQQLNVKCPYLLPHLITHAEILLSQFFAEVNMQLKIYSFSIDFGLKQIKNPFSKVRHIFLYF